MSDATPPGPRRMTTATLQIVSVFMADPSKEWYGRALAQETGLGSGTVLQCLYRLEREYGWLESRWEDKEVAKAEGRPPRRFYRLTGVGRRDADRVLRERFKGRLRFATEFAAAS